MELLGGDSGLGSVVLGPEAVVEREGPVPIAWILGGGLFGRLGSWDGDFGE